MDRRVEFIHKAVEEMQRQLIKIGSTLDVRYGTPAAIYKELLAEYKIEKVFANHDYEPYAKKRDREVNEVLRLRGIPFHTHKDQVIFEKSEIVKEDTNPYTVFTPYSKRWKSVVNDFYLSSYPDNKYFSNFYKPDQK